MPIIVAVAGGWDPLHAGHLAHMRSARLLGSKLIVITHTDEMMVRKKGYVFLHLAARLEILKELRCVDQVVVAEEYGDQDGTVTRSLEALPCHIFAKGGDRTVDNMPESEKEVCERLGIEIIYDVGEKVNSSSALVETAARQLVALGRIR